MPVRTVPAHRFRPLIIQALLLPLIAMVLFGGVLLWRVMHVLTDQWWVDHTDHVIEDTSALRAVHLKAESESRGYLLTRDPAFRAAFEAQRAAMEPGTAALQRLVDDNPPQVAAAGRIREFRQQWLQLIDEELDRADHGGDWLSIVKSGLPHAKMQAIDDGFNAFIATERGLRTQRINRTRNSLKLAIWISVATAALVGLILAMTARRQLGFLSRTYDTALREVSEAADILERRVAERTAELASANEAMRVAAVALRVSNDRLNVSNRELQDFASVASHDLQEPLRKVQAFGDRIKAKAGDTLTPELNDYLDRMLNAAARMKSLINDLLTFARVTSRAQPFNPVDLKLVVDQVLSDLESRIEEKHATVDVGELPVIDADATQMRQLMQNLIGNALKFCKLGEHPHVEVSSRSRVAAEGELWVTILVRDHGIGFEEKYLDRIFTVFQRLHGRNEFEGTGIGLAVCRKIVERHRGRITAESRLGDGATFIVELPGKQPIVPLGADGLEPLPSQETIDAAVTA